MQVVFVYADTPNEMNTSIWRCKWPAEALSRNGHSAALFFREDWLRRRPIHVAWGAEADVIVYERVATTQTLEDIKFWKRHGKKIVFSFDDAYDIMPDTIFTKSIWHVDGKSFGEPLITHFYEAMELADAVETPSEVMCERYSKYAKTLYIPNYPDLNNPNWEKPYPVKIPGRVGWAGGASHITSFTDSNILPAIQNMPITIIGGHPKIINMLNDCHHVPAVPHNFYPYLLGQLSIGLAPLAGEFDYCRSWIKCLEYSLKGIPWVVTDSPPYKDCVGGLKIQNKSRAWKGAINYLLNEDTSAMIEEGMEWAWAQGVDAHIQERVEEYGKL